MNRSAPITAGWVCVGLSLLLAPLALVALVLGAITVNRGETGQGTAIMIGAVVSFVLALVLYGAV